MQVYLVGGAVRDALLGLPVKERDWVVVGATPEQMLAQGFQPVGKDFPVFLHPETHEEYALARTERKTGKGYKGFVFHADAAVTLEQDLKRRDLTINAIAQSAEGVLIDPYQGQQDIAGKVLRHVSDAFCEDPVRILRVARFASKLPDFSLDEETLALMKKMVMAGEVDALVAERVWKECVRALMEVQPKRFFDILFQCGAFKILFSNIQLTDRDYTALGYAVKQQAIAEVRWAALLAHQSLAVIKVLLQRYRIPRVFSDVVLMISNEREAFYNICQSDPVSLLSFIKSVDVMRRPERFDIFYQACQAVHQDDLSQQQQHIKKAVTLLKEIDIAALNCQGLKGAEFAQALQQLQIQALATL